MNQYSPDPSSIKKLSKTLTNFRSNSLTNIRPANATNFNSVGSRKGISMGKIRPTATHEQSREKRLALGLRGRNGREGQSKDRGSPASQQINSSAAPIKQGTSRNKSRSELSRLSRDHSPAPFVLSSKKSIPEQITDYIGKRQDVEIVQHFESYKKQFYTKCKVLHNYIGSSEEPEKIKSLYLNEADSHFRNGLEAVMLKLFRSGIIVPQSYTNLRQDAVDEIQKWVIGWVHRKIMYGKLTQDEDNQVLMVEDSLKFLEDYRKEINSQDTSF